MFYELDFLNLLYSTIVLTHYVLSDPICMFSNSDLVRQVAMFSSVAICPSFVFRHAAQPSAQARVIN